MSAAFVVAAVLMTLLALAFVLLPLLRRGATADPAAAQREALVQAHAAGVLSDAEYQAKLQALPGVVAPAAVRPARTTALVLALLLPVAAGALYVIYGEPRALTDTAARPTGASAEAAASDAANAGSLEEATAGLAERMRENPDDLGGWMLLGRAYKNMQRFDAAREALANAYRLAPQDPDVLTEYAEALTLAADTRRIQGEAAAMLDAALAAQPTHPRALWLKGIQAYQEGNFAAAASHWQTLRQSLPADADVIASLDERIAEARTRAGMSASGEPNAAAASAGITTPPSIPAPPTSPAAAPVSGAPRTDDGSTAARLTVEVDIAPELKAKIGASDVLFVFARAASGPRMPLAIQRLSAADLPVTVTLDDSTSMMPQLTLSSVPQVVVGARVSKSGQAVPQAGDFEALSNPVSHRREEPVQLRIERIVE